MSELTLQRGAVRYTIKGATPILITKGNALIVTGKVTPLQKSVPSAPRLKLVQAS